MKLIRFFIACSILMGSLIISTPLLAQTQPQKVSAFIRVKNEMPTLEACLKSIDGLFDRIVLVHSNEPDDGSIAFMNKWCAERPYCDIYEYPHKVYPSMTKIYENGIKPENTMAAYANFGLSKFDEDEWIVNIDADQVYMRERLRNLIQKIKSEYPKNAKNMYCMKGYNTFSWNNILVKVRPQPIMGTYCDHYAIKKNMLAPYKPFGSQFLIRGEKGFKYAPQPEMYWFHFKKVLKAPKATFDKDSVSESAISYLKDNEASEYIQYIADYFPPDHPYSLYNMSLYPVPTEKIVPFKKKNAK